MRTLLRKCEECGRYTLKDKCSCGNMTIVPQPARFSPQDRFGKYRRILKNQKAKENKI
ncbi:MAG: RNA-protein complex protein Nop10 [Methanomassiliicoccales archaeon]|nr:MAG: RNA-protein complex protein Nop10 [Methanomassiliicoccales archaeon]